MFDINDSDCSNNTEQDVVSMLNNDKNVQESARGGTIA